MTILIISVGTRGDIQPFVQLGMRLLVDGHRVRIATHKCFRDYVTGKGLEFYPLAGDPIKLSEFMVKSEGCIIPTSPELLKEAPAYHAVMVEIMKTCWESCIQQDPQGDNQEQWGEWISPHAIIGNPVCYAHIHCAEALSVPLHLMFPQPWTPTKAFPHPLSCMSYSNSWSFENYLSYSMIDGMLWASFEADINKIRTNMGLQPLRAGQGGWNIVNIQKVPFVKMWSPSFVPKPKDWPEYVDIVGTFFDSTVHDNNKDNSTTNISDCVSPVSPAGEQSFQPSEELLHFLNSNNGNTEKVPIFVGFGSMVLENPEKIISIILEAAALANVRVIVQVGWSIINPQKFKELALNAQTKAGNFRKMVQLNNDNKINENLEEVSDDDNSTVVSSSGATPTTPLSNSYFSNNNNDNTLMKEAIEKFSMSMHSVKSNEDSNINNSNTFSEKVNSMNQSIMSSNNNVITEEDINKVNSIKDWLMNPFNRSKSSVNSQVINQIITEREVQAESDISQGWDDLSDLKEEDFWSADNDAFLVGACPHSYLFTHVRAVVHHGGAGTTATGLRYGCPTWICPFFGDQHFWGEMVYKRGLGPKPIPIKQLEVDKVAYALLALGSTELKTAANALKLKMINENGVENAVDAFYRHLPLDNMLCDVSLFSGGTKNGSDKLLEPEYRIAEIYCPQCGLKMAADVADLIHSQPALHLQDHSLLPCRYKDWTPPAPGSVYEGIVQGVGGLMHEVTGGVTDALYNPLKGMYSDGLQGYATGLTSGLKSLAQRPITGSSVLWNKLSTGFRQYLDNNNLLVTYMADPSQTRSKLSHLNINNIARVSDSNNAIEGLSSANDLANAAAAFLQNYSNNTKSTDNNSKTETSSEDQLDNIVEVQNKQVNNIDSSCNFSNLSDHNSLIEMGNCDTKSNTKKSAIDNTTTSDNNLLNPFDIFDAPIDWGSTFITTDTNESITNFNANTINLEDNAECTGVVDDDDGSVYYEEESVPVLLCNSTLDDTNSATPRIENTMINKTALNQQSIDSQENCNSNDGSDHSTTGDHSNAISVHGTINNTTHTDCKSQDDVNNDNQQHIGALHYSTLHTDNNDHDNIYITIRRFHSAMIARAIFEKLLSNNNSNSYTRSLSYNKLKELLEYAVLRTQAIDFTSTASTNDSYQLDIPSEDIVILLMKLFGRSKSYIDFVDFAVLYQQLYKR